MGGKGFPQRQHVNNEDDEHAQQFGNERDMKRHALEGIVKRYPCNICQSTFSRKDNLKTHKLRVHYMSETEISNPKFKCSHCGKLLKTKAHLKRHQGIHAGVSCACHICTRSFSRKDGLIRHISKHHPQANFRKNNVKAHLQAQGKIPRSIKSLAVNDSSYKCSQCGKLLKSRSVMKRHLDIHAGLSFPCYFCTQSFGRKDTLRRHIKVKHSQNPINHKELKEVKVFDKDKLQCMLMGCACCTDSVIDVE